MPGRPSAISAKAARPVLNGRGVSLSFKSMIVLFAFQHAPADCPLALETTSSTLRRDERSCPAQSYLRSCAFPPKTR